MNDRNDQFDDANLEALLRQVGTRDEPSPEVATAIRSAVHAEWQAMIDEQRRNRRRWMWGIAASVLGVMFAVALVFNGVLAPSVVVATVAYVDGNVSDNAHGKRLSQGEILKSDDRVHTDENAHASLNIGKDLSLRLDANTSVKLLAANRVELERGALYVDSRGSTPLLVETSVGAVHHLGTQYQVRSREGEIEVSVREGKIEVRNARGSNIASAGERLRVTEQGDVSRTSVSRGDPTWAWVTQATSVPDIENQTLDAFLRWVAAETGREVVYATPQAQQLATTIRLHGSIHGLDPEAALAAVLQTTEFRRYQTKDELIGITLVHAIESGNVMRPTP